MPMGFGGNERTSRRAVAAAKARWRAGHRRTYRPCACLLNYGDVTAAQKAELPLAARHNSDRNVPIAMSQWP